MTEIDSSGSTPTKLSVITITFNDPDGLARTLDSVMSQSGDFEIEHIIVDGGQSTATFDIVKSRNSPAIVVSEPDDGRYDAMNKGIAGASGDVLWFMHSGDEFATPDAMSIALRHLDSPRRGWGHGLAMRIDQRRRDRGILGMRDFEFPRFALGMGVIPHQAAFFGRDVIAAAGGYHDEVGIGADQEFMLRAALASPPVVIDEVLCLFDATGAGSGRKPYHHFFEHRRFRVKNNVDLYRIPGQDLLTTARLSAHRTAVFTLWRLAVRVGLKSE